MATALAPVTAVIASVVHIPLRRVEVGSTCSMATNLPCYRCDARVIADQCCVDLPMLPMCNVERARRVARSASVGAMQLHLVGLDREPHSIPGHQMQLRS